MTFVSASARKISVTMTSVTTSKLFGILPYAHALEGSVVLRSFLGFTRAHAATRARNWIRRNV